MCAGMSVNEYWERGGAWDEQQLKREQLDKVRFWVIQSFRIIDMYMYSSLCKKLFGHGMSSSSNANSLIRWECELCRDFR